jgi:hypothetical protein
MGAANAGQRAGEIQGAPRLALYPDEFLKEEFKRIGQNIRIDLLSSALLCIGVASVGMYAAPFLSGGLLIACQAVAAAAILAILVYEYRRFSHLKLMRDDVAAKIEDRLKE